jgi:hypothetical protein
VIVIAHPHLWRNPIRRRKRQKSLFLFTAQQIGKNESLPSLQRVQIWNDHSQKQKSITAVTQSGSVGRPTDPDFLQND